MRQLIPVLFFFFLALTAHAQPLYIEGVITAPGGAAVAYATIGIKGSTRSVMSNEQGYFQAGVSSFPQVVVISAIGYDVKEVVFTGSSKQVITLAAKSYSLGEVTVKGDEAYKLFMKAYKKLMKPGYTNYNGKVFYRLVTQNDDRYTELMEGFYDVQANPSGFNYWKLKHGRYAVADDCKQQNYVVSIDLSALVRYLDITNDHRSGIHFPAFPFTADAKSGYRFEKAGGSSIGNKDVSIIRFTPETNNPNACEGLLYIEESSGKLFRMEARYAKDESNLITTQVGKENVKQLAVAFTVDFSEDRSGRMLLNWINIALAYTQPDGPFRRRIKTNIQCMVYEKDAAVNIKDKLVVPQTFSDYEAIRSRLYIKRFWDENPVIAQTVLQQQITADFESRGSFGTAYNSANDTLVLLKEGYALLERRVNGMISAIHETPVRSHDISCISLMLNGKVEGSLCSRLFVAYNCYRDSFHFYVLPLMDTTQTWISDSIKNDDSFSTVFKLYARITRLRAKQLDRAMTALTQPCKKEEEIEKMITKANEELYREQSELMQDVWQKGEFYFWERYVEKAEKE